MPTRLTVLVVLTVTLIGCSDARVNVLTPDGSPSFVLMDFSEPFSLDPLPDGWFHRRFWRHGPMDMSFETKEGVPAIRLATHDTASMLFRHVDVELDAYPTLTWRWFIEQGIDAEVDESTHEGDDHPARFMMVFDAPDGQRYRMEIIWGNRSFRAGSYEYIGGFPHYVANAGQANIGRWIRERVDLTEIYRELWGDPAGTRVVDIALFCDSDDTSRATVAYIADVRVERREADPERVVP